MRFSTVLKVGIPLASLIGLAIQTGLSVADYKNKKAHRKNIEESIKDRGVTIAILRESDLKK